MSSPANACLLSWCSPGTTNDCGTLVIPEIGLLWCSLGGPQCPVLISSHFSEPSGDLPPSYLESKLYSDFAVVNPGVEIGLSFILLLCEYVHIYWYFAESIYWLSNCSLIIKFTNKNILCLTLAWKFNLLVPIISILSWLNTERKLFGMRFLLVKPQPNWLETIYFRDWDFNAEIEDKIKDAASYGGLLPHYHLQVKSPSWRVLSLMLIMGMASMKALQKLHENFVFSRNYTWFKALMHQKKFTFSGHLPWTFKILFFKK